MLEEGLITGIEQDARQYLFGIPNIDMARAYLIEKYKTVDPKTISTIINQVWHERKWCEGCGD